MNQQEFLAAVPAPQEDEKTVMIEGEPYHIVSFEDEANRDSFISDIKEKMGLIARPVDKEITQDYQFFAAVPAPEETEDTRDIDGSPFYVFGFHNEDDMHNFIEDVKEKQDVEAHILERVASH
ncbi:hypothetical protein ABIB38_004294 [Massilia sp. UYP11]|uniref:hypothetical protein n=1 Tax=Massilia sp. UYP11 TaxID=1756385 RepID=UPI003D1C08DF